MNRLVLLLASAACLPAQAQQLSSLDAVVDGNTPVSYNQWLASSFVASSDALESFVNSISLEAICLVPNSNVYVAVTGSNGGRPDLKDIRVVMDASPLVAEVQMGTDFVFTLVPLADQTSATLTPDQEYWVVFGATAPDYEEGNPAGLYQWNFAAGSGPFHSEGGWSFGPSISSAGTAGQNWTSEVNTPYVFGLSLAPVPEPAGSLMFLAAPILLLRRIRNSHGQDA